MIKFHGLYMNGGIINAVKQLDQKGLKLALGGFEYFGFNQVVLIIEEAISLVEKDDNQIIDESEAHLHLGYMNLIPDDSVMMRRFEVDYEENPSNYLPI